MGEGDLDFDIHAEEMTNEGRENETNRCAPLMQVSTHQENRRATPREGGGEVVVEKIEKLVVRGKDQKASWVSIAIADI